MENIKNQKRKSIKDVPFKADLQLGPFKILNELGEGQFGSVFSGIHEGTNEKVAIKQINKSKIEKEKLFTSEINIHKNLFHPNICRMYCVIENENYIFLINEFCSGGDILQNIIEKGAFDEEKSCKIFQQIICGLEYLHKNFICHRDIKSENILLTNIDKKNIKVKISDFGFSKSFAGDKLLKTPCGSPAYAAPEMLRGKEYKGNKIDIWSSGVVLYTMVYGVLPFDQDNIKDLVYNITEGKYSLPNTISENCQDLIKKILEIDPNKRINIHDIKNHPWMKQFKFNLMKSPGIFINEDILPIDEEIIKEMAGKNKSKIHEYIDDIIKNKHNSNTVSYYLRVNKKVNKGEMSISDLSSNSFLFLSYIDNEISKKKYWDENLDSRIKSLEDEIYKSLLRDKKSIDSRNKLTTSARKDLDFIDDINNNSLNKINTISLFNKTKITNNNQLNINKTINLENDNDQKSKEIKPKKIKKSNSQSNFGNYKEQNAFESINEIKSSNKRHFKDDKYIKNIDIEDNKKENNINKNFKSLFYQKIPIVIFAHNIVDDIINKVLEKKNVNQNNEDNNTYNIRKKYLNQFITKNDNNNEQKIKVNEEGKNNTIDIDESINNKNNNIMQFIFKQLKFTKNNNCKGPNNINNGFEQNEKLNNKNNLILKIDKEESKQQILRRKQMIKIKLPYNGQRVNNEKKKKIISNRKFHKNIQEDKNISNSSKNNNNLLNFFTLDNFISKENSNKKLNANNEDNIPFKKHQKIKKLLKDSKSEEENKNENIIHYKKDIIKEEKESNDNNFSFKTESTFSKIEIDLKNLINELNIINKSEKEINYNCQKIDEKGENLNFNLQIIEGKDKSNIISCKLINGNNNSFEEIFNIIKNILQFK